MICTILIILINVLVYFACLATENYISTGGANYQYIVENAEYGRLLSCMFLHSSSAHLIANMVALWFFGTTVEKRLGSCRMTVLYFLSGISAACCSIFAYHLLSPDTMVYSIGASGAIFGLLACAAILNYKLGITSLFQTTMAIVIYVVLDSFILWSMDVDIFAHIGGTIPGTILTMLMTRNFEEEYHESKLSKGLGIALSLCLSILSVCAADLGQAASILPETKIQFVKNGSPSAAPNITYGKAFEEFFTDPHWDGEAAPLNPQSEQDDTVEFTGTCIYHSRRVAVRIQFTLNFNDNTYQVSYLSLDDEPQTNQEIHLFFQTIWSSYKKNS